jgi:F-type H+-transporting ATPase subunit b
MGETIILVVALLILAAAVYRPLTRAIFGALDTRAERIKHELEEAQRLREEAQSMLANYQRKLHEGEAQAKAIVDHAHEEAQRLERLSREQLEQRMQRRTQQAMDRIAAAESRALQDVRAQAAQLSVQATRELMKSHLDGDRARAVMDQSLEEIRRELAS